MIGSTPRIVTGIYPFAGAGLPSPTALEGAPSIYRRAGLMRDGAPMRLFPIGAMTGMHVPLAMVEDLFPETLIEISVAAEEGASGHIVLDMGLMEV